MPYLYTTVKGQAVRPPFFICENESDLYRRINFYPITGYMGMIAYSTCDERGLYRELWIG
jgi:hypothetical protein